MTRVSVSFKAPTELVDLLRELDGRLSDFSVPLAKVAALLLAEAHAYLDAEGRGEWAPMSEATERRDKYSDKRRGSDGNRPIGAHRRLYQSGYLRGSLIREWSKYWAAVYTKAPHAYLHQWGTVHIPARTFLFLDDETAEKAIDIILDWAAMEERGAA